LDKPFDPEKDYRELCRRQADRIRELEARFDVINHLHNQREWSEKTFGPGRRTKGICDHIRKELQEIEANPDDIEEWIDIVILGFDGAWRAGASPEEIVSKWIAKHEKNMRRKWPDWRTRSEDEAIEHIRK
jgi:hypothetical protein